MAENEREYVEYIKTIVDGDSAFDFRDKVNQMGRECNDALNELAVASETIKATEESIKQAKADIENSAEEVKAAAADVKETVEDFDDYVEEKKIVLDEYTVDKEEEIYTFVEEKKPEIIRDVAKEVAKDITEIPIIQVRRLQPTVDTNGFFPDFWFQIIPQGEEPIIISSYLCALVPSFINVYSNFESGLKRKNLIVEESTASTDYKIEAEVFYNSAKTPSANTPYFRFEVREEGGLTFQLAPDTGVGFVPSVVDEHYIVLSTRESTNWADYATTQFDFTATESNGNQAKNIDQNYTLKIVFGNQ